MNIKRIKEYHSAETSTHTDLTLEKSKGKSAVWNQKENQSSRTQILFRTEFLLGDALILKPDINFISLFVWFSF